MTIFNTPNYGTIFATTDTFAELRAVSATKIQDGYWALVAGGLAPRDGLGGIFHWDSNSTAADNDETVIRPTESVGSGRWVMIAVGQVGADGANGGPGPQGTSGATGAPGPAGSVADYTGTLTSTGTALTRFRANSPDTIDGSGKNNRADILLGLSRNSFSANHSGSGAPYAYVDDVMCLGTNVDANRSRPNTQNAGFGLFFENKFWFGGRFNTEMQMCSAGLDGSARRVFQGIFPENGTDRDAAQLAHGVDKFIGYDFFGEERYNWNLRTGTFDHVGGTTYRFNGNNSAVIQQMNSTGSSFVPLPFIDSDNYLRGVSPTVRVANVPTNAVYGLKAADILQLTGLSNGSYLKRSFGNAVSGTLYTDAPAFDASGDLIHEITNLNPTSGKAVMNLQSDAGAANSEYRVNGQKVVGARQAAIANATDAATVITQLNALLAAARAHGLIA